ncbi:PAAR domain-containing protein [Stenotrophomonas sp.]|uniref:PAAR domain-containing protein n=1 Tax=Stenotrophomonas sp. TaxID=69392 RepID=UPI0028A5B892|nr:PAAR domain-containing protein [Stenotrophomonas sp.]
MARTLIVVGDALQAGGSVLTGSPQTDIDGHPVARIGDRVICARHGPGSILTGDATLVIDGQPVARHGDKASCGCALLAGKQQLAHVSAGGAPVAAAAVKAGRLSQAVSSSQPLAPLLARKPVAEDEAEPAQCWLNDHSCQVLVSPNERYFEAYAADGELLDIDLISSFRIDVPLKSGGDIVVTSKIKIFRQEGVSDSDVEIAKERLQSGVSARINSKFVLSVCDGFCGTRSFPIRYEVNFVNSGEDYHLFLHKNYPREEVIGRTIHVTVDTDQWIHVHELMHCLGLPDEYMDDREMPITIRYFMPDGVLSPDALVTVTMREDDDPESSMMFDQYNPLVKPRHAWNIGLEVQDLLSREIGREIACTVLC